MKVVTVDTTAGGVEIVAAGPAIRRDILIIKNGATAMFVKFDNSATVLSAANGMPMAANEILNLSGLPVRQVLGITAAGSTSVAVQGD